MAAMPAKGDFSQLWTRRLQDMVAKMTPEELAKFPDLKRIDEAHNLIFNATFKIDKAGLSLLESISACGRRLRGIRLGLATDTEFKVTCATSLYKALTQAYGMDGLDERWPAWDPNFPLEMNLGVMMIMEWQGMYLPGADAEDAPLLAAQLERSLQVWRDESYKIKVMERLKELGVVDFNPDDFFSRLLHLLADFYLKHPEGAEDFHRGISLLEEIVVFDREAFSAAETLACIKMKQGNPQAGYRIAKRALDHAIASGFQCYASRLGLCAAVAILEGACGYGYSMANVTPLLEASRRRIDACKFWLPPDKYELYNGRLRDYERRFKITPESSNTNPGETSSNAIPTQLPTEPTQPTTAQSRLRHCSGCKEPSIETKKCSGCREVYYCSMKCQKGHWSSHKETCKRKQAEREAFRPESSKAK